MSQRSRFLKVAMMPKGMKARPKNENTAGNSVATFQRPKKNAARTVRKIGALIAAADCSPEVSVTYFGSR